MSPLRASVFHKHVMSCGIQNLIFQEEQRKKNMEVSELGEDDKSTGMGTALKSLGKNNPNTIRIQTNAEEDTVTVQGGERLFPTGDQYVQ